MVVFSVTQPDWLNTSFCSVQIWNVRKAPDRARNPETRRSALLRTEAVNVSSGRTRVYVSSERRFHASGSRYCSVTLIILVACSFFCFCLFVMSSHKFCFLSPWLRSDAAGAAAVATRPGPYKAWTLLETWRHAILCFDSYYPVGVEGWRRGWPTHLALWLKHIAWIKCVGSFLRQTVWERRGGRERIFTFLRENLELAITFFD